jgi:NADPH:quinone reductase-like Zn-dependent oxidoreductase
MKAIVNTRFGPPEVLQLKEVDKPVPGENEILVRIKATAVNSGDWRLRKPDPFAVRFFFGLIKPKHTILGGVFAGDIEAVGSKVVNFKKGDAVFGTTGMSFGAYAEYKCLPANGVVAIKPININYAEAAVVPFGGLTALYFLRKANIKSGQSVLVYGASGAVGSAAVQLATHFGAEVTAVCSSGNADLARSLGAVRIVDYNTEDFSKHDTRYDVIFDTVDKISFNDGIRMLKKDGILLFGSTGLSNMLRGAISNITGSKKVISGVIKETAEGLNFLKELIANGKYKPVIDRTYPLEDMVAAHHYVEQGHKKGNVAILVEPQ